MKRSKDEMGSTANREQWHKVEPEEKKTWRPERIGESLEGNLEELRDVPTRFGPRTLAEIRQSNGERCLVWASGLLAPLLRQTWDFPGRGTLIRIIYRGRGEASGGRLAPHLWEVFFRA